MNDLKKFKLKILQIDRISVTDDGKIFAINGSQIILYRDGKFIKLIELANRCKDITIDHGNNNNNNNNTLKIKSNQI